MAPTSSLTLSQTCTRLAASRAVGATAADGPGWLPLAPAGNPLAGAVRAFFFDRSPAAAAVATGFAPAGQEPGWVRACASCVSGTRLSIRLNRPTANRQDNRPV